MVSKQRCVILGADLGGLSAGIRMAARGARVIFCEKNPSIAGAPASRGGPRVESRSDQPGEQAFRVEKNQAGLLTLPLVFADLFSYAGRDIRDYLSIRRCDPAARFVWADGQVFSLRAKRADLVDEIRRFAPEDVRGVVGLLDYGKRVWDLAGEFLFARSSEQILRPDGRLSPRNAIRLAWLTPRIGLIRKYAPMIDRNIRNLRLRQIFHHYAASAGFDPLLAPAAVLVLPHIELDQGVWEIEGGMDRLRRALEQLARELGVEIRTDGSVRRLLNDEGFASDGKAMGIVRGVELEDGSRLEADAVIVSDDSSPLNRGCDNPVNLRSLFRAMVRSSHRDPGVSGLFFTHGPLFSMNSPSSLALAGKIASDLAGQYLNKPSE